MTLACPSSTPAPATVDDIHKLVWIGFSTLSSEIAAALTDFAPWIGAAIASKLISVDSLCATNPDVPDAWVNGDVAGTLGDLFQSAFPSADFMAKLARYIEYEAFLQYCACGDTPTPPSFTPTGHCTVDNQSACVSHGFALDSASQNSACSNGCSYVLNINWLFTQCANARVFVYPNQEKPFGGFGTCFPSVSPAVEVPVTWTAVSGTCGAGYETSGQFGPFPDTGGSMCNLSGFYTSADDPQVLVSCPGDTGPDFGVHWDGSITATVLCNAPPGTSLPPPDITVPPSPTQDCGSDTICAITWLINRNTQNNIQYNNSTNSTVTNIAIGSTGVGTVQKYVTGDSHSVSGIGTISVGTVVGVLVQLGALADGTGLVVSDPTRYFDTGWVAFGNAEGFTAAERVEHASQVFLTSLQDVTTIGFNTERAATWTITELVVPPPPV